MSRRDAEGRLLPPSIDPEQEAFLRVRVKAELRTRLKAIRRALPAAVRAERNAALLERLREAGVFDAPRAVACFVALPGEVDLSPLVDARLARGLAVALPRVDETADELVLHVHAPDRPLVASAFGVREPTADAPVLGAADVSIVLVPGLGFDPRGHRLGYGRGYYDRLLPTLPNALHFGVALDFQLLPELPVSPADVPVHRIFTDLRTLDAAPAATN